VDMPDTHHSVPGLLKANSSQLNGLMQLGTSESRPTHRAMDAVRRCVTALCIDLAESIISSYSAYHGYFVPSFMPKLCVAGILLVAINFTKLTFATFLSCV